MFDITGGGYDLHTHTTASDGLLSPEESVTLARKQGLAGLAITDHDTVSGVEEALRAGEALGIEVIPGVEISASRNGQDIHVLGLWIDIGDVIFAGRLSRNRDIRRTRNAAMIEALRGLGFQVTLEEAERLAAERRGDGDSAVSRPHLAELLVRKGYVSSMQEAFDIYLAEGGQAFVTVDRIDPSEAIDWIHDAGGKAILAHPGLYVNSGPLIEELSVPLDGLEVAHADHDREQERSYLAMAERLGLIATAGSDFHGLRAGVPFHAMLGSRTVHRETLERLKAIK